MFSYTPPQASQRASLSLIGARFSEIVSSLISGSPAIASWPISERDRSLATFTARPSTRTVLGPLNATRTTSSALIFPSPWSSHQTSSRHRTLGMPSARCRNCSLVHSACVHWTQSECRHIVIRVIHVYTTYRKSRNFCRWRPLTVYINVMH